MLTYTISELIIMAYLSSVCVSGAVQVDLYVHVCKALVSTLTHTPHHAPHAGCHRGLQTRKKCLAVFCCYHAPCTTSPLRGTPLLLDLPTHHAESNTCAASPLPSSRSRSLTLRTEVGYRTMGRREHALYLLAEENPDLFHSKQKPEITGHTNYTNYTGTVMTRILYAENNPDI